MDKHHSKILILVCLIISTFSVLYVLKANQKDVTSGATKPTYTPPVAVADSPQSTTMLAPDGKHQITMKVEKAKKSTTYTFVVKDEATGASKTVFTKTVPMGTPISLPLNTFSPDDKYIFLKEESSSGVTYFVPLEDKIFDISALFKEKYPEYVLTEVTGWGGMTLLVVNADKKEGGIGPSVWFDVSTGSFINLSTRFN